MKPELEKLFEFMQILQNMKSNKRWLDTPSAVHKESIADHSWKATVMVFVVYNNINSDLDLLKMLKMTLVHDIIESIAGDTDYQLVYLGKTTVEAKFDKELAAITHIRETLPKKIGDEIFELWLEYDRSMSTEARFVKAVEKTEATIHAIHTGPEIVNIPDLFATYCKKSIANAPELKGYYYEVNKKLKELFRQGGHQWLESYETKGEFEEFKDFEKVFSFFELAQKLKFTKRYASHESEEIKESVADHSYRLAFFVWISIELLELDLDLLKSIELALFHNITESIAGDISCDPEFRGLIKKEDKQEDKKNAIEIIRNTLPSHLGTKVHSLWEEYEEIKTEEAKFVKALNKIESIDHFIRFGTDFIDNPDQIATHLNSSILFDPKTIDLHGFYKDRLSEVYSQGGIK